MERTAELLTLGDNCRAGAQKLDGRLSGRDRQQGTGDSVQLESGEQDQHIGLLRICAGFSRKIIKGIIYKANPR